ncbi:hypothetical protein J2W83_004682 [Pseudomonas hunanensis]|uniref:Uncharacterized protein n=1 Tax=Pseudomonas hunanensis TaxID=1247546 RepID=A0ACC6K9H4_9PSED|nr:hypothetical protein [Pseudomonas hunanensis]
MWLAGLRPAICIGSPGLFAGQARSYRGCAEFKICAVPVAGLSREEARISTTPATIEDNASPDATRNRGCAEFKICAVPVGAGLSREEARISTTPATIEDNASPDATRNRGCAEFKICAIPVGAGLSREEARISTTHATIKNNASPDATRNFATSGGRMQEQAVFGYFFPRKKVTRRRGGRGQWRDHIKRISPHSSPHTPKAQPKRKGAEAPLVIAAEVKGTRTWQ